MQPSAGLGIDERAVLVAQLGPVDAGPTVTERGITPAQGLAQPVLGGVPAEPGG